MHPIINYHNKNQAYLDKSHSGIKNFLDNIPINIPKNGKNYIVQESDVLNIKKNYVDYKRSKSAINLKDLREKGYAGVLSSDRNKVTLV